MLPASRNQDALPRLFGMIRAAEPFDELEVDDFIARIQKLIFQCIENAKSNAPYQIKDDGLKGIGMSLTDPVELKTGVIVYPTQHPLLRRAPLRQKLINAFNDDALHIIVENDANLGAFGELIARKKIKGDQVQHLVYVIASAGIGAGIIINGEIYAGFRGFAGEFEHTIIGAMSAIMCSDCGQKGCLETLASGAAIAREGHAILPEIEHAEHFQREQTLSERNGFFITADGRTVFAQPILDAAKKGNSAAIQVVQRAGTYLGEGLVALFHTLDPQLILLGGIVETSNVYMDAVTECVQAQRHAAIQHTYFIETGLLGMDASLLGAALRAEHLWLI